MNKTGMTRKVLLGATVIGMMALLPGCGGAKKSCKKSAQSYFSVLSGHSWKTMYKMLTEEHRKQIGTPKRLEQFMEYELEYLGSKNFKLKKMEAFPGRDSCNVQIVYDYAVKLRGQEEVQYSDIEETLIFKKSSKDGLWYMEVPGASDLAGF